MDFMHKLQGSLSQGLATSRELYSKAKVKAKDLSEKGLIKFEIMQLEKQAEVLMGQLGATVFDLLSVQGSSSVPGDNSEVRRLIDEIVRVKRQIDEREEALRKVGQS